MRMQIIKCNWNNRSSIAYIDLDYLFKKTTKKTHLIPVRTNEEIWEECMPSLQVTIPHVPLTMLENYFKRWNYSWKLKNKQTNKQEDASPRKLSVCV